MKLCVKCKNNFEIRPQDQIFYDKIKVPEPTFCPECRNQRRMSFRNERHLYQRKCDFCSKSFLSIYEENREFPVYCYNCWWSDTWDALSFGQAYDSGRSFFKQLKKVFNNVPHLGIVTAYCENSDYANYTNYSKNCYLIFGCHAAEDCYYGWRVHDSLSCVDCLQIDKSKYCYDCVDCDECYELFYSQDCSRCNNSAFLYDCKGCQNCLFSAGIRNKQYCVFNKQYTKELYEKEKQKFNFGSHEGLLVAREKFQEFLKNYPKRATFIINSENVSGDHIINSKNVHFGFNSKNIHDGAYLESCEDLKDAMDSTFSGWPAELNYEGISAGCVNSYNTKFCDTSWSNTNIEYCNSCHHSQELFGCFGMRRKNEYCILNKQYSASEYAEVKQKIINDMIFRKEYGEFFPLELSPFAYNETVANDYYSLCKENALAKGFSWKERNPKEYLPQNYDIPDHIQDVPDAITKEVLACEQCHRNYKIVTQELKFYQKFNLPIPRYCFHCRHQSRMNKRNPRQLWQRECSKCQTSIKTTYSPERSEKVYCEKCYLQEIY
ncbi:hypothetical protein HYV57_03095 [Candidatus Peregrinibacteria bacterium]|nr:hypothetical protein [Candidatus Peregrinibacteria bacterium]